MYFTRLSFNIRKFCFDMNFQLLLNKIKMKEKFRFIGITLIILAGITWAYVEFQRLRENDFKLIRLDFERIAETRTSLIEKEIALNLSALYDLHGLFKASMTVKRDEFRTFTEPILSRIKTIQALEWIPRVFDSEADVYKRRARADGLATFQFTERETQGKMVSAKKRSEYFPVYYVEPLERNMKALGFDLASNSTRLVTLKRSRDIGRILATAGVTLVQENGEQKGFLVFVPQFSGNPVTISERREQLTGFVLGVYRIGDMFEKAISSVMNHDRGVVTRLLDLSAPRKEQLLYIPESGQAFVSSIVFERTIDVAGRKWSVESFPTSKFVSSRRSKLPHLAAGIIIIISWFVCFFLIFLFKQINRKQEMELLAEARTKDLAESEKKMSTIIETVPNGIITIDNHGLIQSFNQAAEEIFGYSTEEVVGHNINIIVPNPHHSQHDRYIQNYLRTGERKILGIGREVMGQRKDGSVFPLYLSVDEMNFGNNIMFVGIVIDITERKKAEQDIRQFEFMSNAAPDGMTLINSDGIYCAANRAYLAMQKKSQSEIVGKKVSEVWGKKVFTHQIHNYFRRCLNGEANQRETRFGLPGIGIRWIKVFYLPFTNTSQEHFAVVISRDITAEKKAEEALIHAKESAETSNRVKTEFLNVMSHELRTPLTVIKGNLEELLNIDDLPEPDDIVEIAGDSYDSGLHLLTLINDLLDLSKIEAGRLQLAIETIPIKNLIEETVNSVKGLATNKKINLNFEAEEIEVNADSVRLRQILLNLLSNAIKYTTTGSINVFVNKSKENGDAIFQVQDSGCGIAEKDLPIIFDPFRQIDASLTRKTGGTGLGLAITKKLVDLHGGKIWAESKVGVGSSFYYSIPITPENI